MSLEQEIIGLMDFMNMEQSIEEPFVIASFVLWNNAILYNHFFYYTHLEEERDQG
jgi:hypothetical protein